VLFLSKTRALREGLKKGLLEEDIPDGLSVYLASSWW